MGRTHVNTIKQPTEYTCGPTSIKHVLAIFGKRRSLSHLIGLCKTSRNGTTTKNMIKAMNALGLSVMTVQNANLRHVMSSLKHSPNKPRAVIVDYLYDLQDTDEPWWQSGHWATVSSFSARDSKITVFDSNIGKKKSYDWYDFRERWTDFDVIKKKKSPRSKKFRTYKKWQKQLMLVVAPQDDFLPKFRYATVRRYPVSVN